jgi:transposase
MIKLRQKVSGCLRNLTGAKQFCAIRSYLSTAAKHGKHFFEVLVMLAEGLPGLPLPFLNALAHVYPASSRFAP